MKKNLLLPVAALSGAIAIMAGAFAAHSASGAAIEWLKTGAFYQLIHAVAVISIVEKEWHKMPAYLFLVGAFIFSTSLYLMALGAPIWFGAITPIGGVLMIMGWLVLAYRSIRQRPEQ
jgi:uncharacterized membrane protein YgdD (TMEM256/DUF423 family)